MEFIFFFVGVFLGISIASIIFRSHFIGDLRIDNMDWVKKVCHFKSKA